MSQLPAMSPQELKTRKVELVLQQLESLPTLPTVASRLIALTSGGEPGIRDIVELVSSDPALTTKFLSLVQSSASGVRHPITNIQQAVVLLGMEAVRNVVLSVKVFDAFQQDPESEGTSFQRAEFWKHSLAVAAATENLAQRAAVKVNRHDAFVCGLLHDIGKVAFDSAMPKSFERAVEVATLTRGDIADTERRIIGLDHAVAGKRLAEAWNLPAVIIQTIWLHGCAPMGLPAGIVSPAIIQLVGLADALVRRQHIGFSGNYLFPFESAQYQKPLGLSDADVAEVVAGLTEQLEIKAKAIGLYDVQSRHVYLQSIANANRELGRLNHTLTAQNRKLATRGECFDMLTRLYQKMIPAASPAQLLTEMGAIAQQFFNCPRLALFSQDPDEGVGEVLAMDAQAAGHESFLMPMPRWAGDQRVDRGGGELVRMASPQLDWLLDRVESFLGSRACHYLPLLCGQRPVGGLVWPRTDQSLQIQTNVDLPLVAQAWGMTLRMAQSREQQNVLTEALAASNRQLAALQQQMVRARSMAHLGEMAAGAAHEMNNPLAVACGRAELLAGKLSDPALKQDAQQIVLQGQRLSQIITDMMEFARPAQPKPAATSIAALTQEAMDEAVRRLNAGNRAPALKLLAAPDLPPVVVDSGQIRQALAEVLINAMQATMAAPAAAETRGEPILIRIRHDPLDRQVIVQVTDRGSGMAEHTARQAFAPFFSAKIAGRQRGMGLTKALRWVELHGGAIRLDSDVHSGTTVVIILPEQFFAPLDIAAPTATLPADEAVFAPVQPPQATLSLRR